MTRRAGSMGCEKHAHGNLRYACRMEFGFFLLQDDLTMTANTQPALLAHSVALFRVIKVRAQHHAISGTNKYAISGTNKCAHPANNSRQAHSFHTHHLEFAQAKCPELLQNVKHVLGHSIGEYPALVVAGSLGLADAAVLVHARGKMMQSASDAASGVRVRSWVLSLSICGRAYCKRSCAAASHQLRAC